MIVFFNQVFFPFILFLFLFSHQSWSQVPCEGEDRDLWTDCVGTTVWPVGTTYIGEWKNGGMSGEGVLLYAEGNKWKAEKYEGTFKNNETHGHGTFTWLNGGQYIGEFKDDEITIEYFNSSGELPLPEIHEWLVLTNWKIEFYQ